jgi:hypothetical protein
MELFKWEYEGEIRRLKELLSKKNRKIRELEKKLKLLFEYEERLREANSDPSSPKNGW